MITRIYKINFHDSIIELNEIYDMMFTEHEKEWVSTLDCESFFDYEDIDENYICYFISKATEIEKYSEILSRNLISHELIDLTDDILKFNINLDEDLKSLLNNVNSIKYSFFKDDLKDWIMNNLNIDSVLDRISLLGGIENISGIEKEFLQNFQLP